MLELLWKFLGNTVTLFIGGSMGAPPEFVRKVIDNTIEELTGREEIPTNSLTVAVVLTALRMVPCLGNSSADALEAGIKKAKDCLELIKCGAERAGLPFELINLLSEFNKTVLSGAQAIDFLKSYERDFLTNPL